MPDHPQTPQQDAQEPTEPEARQPRRTASDPVTRAAGESPSDEAEIDERELERVAVPARVRRAPKFGAFIVAGAVVGVVVALLATAVVGWVSGDGGGLSSDVPSGQGFISFLDGQGTIRVVMGVTGAVVGGFVGGALAARADRRSRDPLA